MTKTKKLDAGHDFQTDAEMSEALDSVFGPAPRPRRRSPDRHGRRCKVCHHPDRDAIEQAFLHWQSPEKIAREFGIAHHSTVYRHAYACGLFTRRGGYIRSALESIIERAADAHITGNDVIKAVRAACCITDDGKWVEPPRKCIIIHETAAESASKTSVTSSAACSASAPTVGAPDTVPLAATNHKSPITSHGIFNSEPRRLEHDPTH
jgi:hypothetical protein